MPQHPFPDPGPDGEEPAGSPLPPAAEGAGPEHDDWDGVGGQGLYVCLPPGQVTLAGFAQNGEADAMAPGALLATVMETVTGPDGGGLAGCSDDQLLGIMSAARRLAARAEWAQLAAIAEFAARHPRSTPAGEFAADELAFELHLTQPSAAGQMDYARTVAGRLPAAFAVLAAGRIHPFQLRIIAEETGILSDADAARADAVLAGAAPGLTFGELRAAARKLVLKMDPEAVAKRKEAARRDAHVRRFREDSGNAGMVARELPSDEVLASWQHVEQRALDLRAAGVPGTLRDLRVRAYLDLLQERDSRDLPAAPHPVGPGPAARGPVGPGPADRGEPGQASDPDQPSPDSLPPGAPGTGPAPDGPGPDGPGPDGPGGTGGPGPRGPRSPAPGTGSGPSLAALVTLTIPWDTWQRRSETPGEADGFGPPDGDDARDLPGRHPPPGTGPPGPRPP